MNEKCPDRLVHSSFPPRSRRVSASSSLPSVWATTGHSHDENQATHPYSDRLSGSPAANKKKSFCIDPASLSRRWQPRHRIFWLRRGNKRTPSSSFLATPQMCSSQSEPVSNRATVDPSSSSGRARRRGVLSAPALRSYKHSIPVLLHGATGASSPLLPV